MTSHILCKLLIIEIRNGKYCFTVKKKKKNQGGRQIDSSLYIRYILRFTTTLVSKEFHQTDSVRHNQTNKCNMPRFEQFDSKKEKRNKKKKTGKKID